MNTQQSISLSHRFQEWGFQTIENVLDDDSVKRLRDTMAGHRDSAASRSRRGSTYAMRNLLAQVPAIGALANSEPLRSLAGQVIGEGAFPVRGILFDKVSQANWAVPWHQDIAIAVREKIEVQGFGPWSVKAGVVHVQPPAQVLESMVTLRVHLDDCDESNGPLRVISGSHRHGILDDDAVAKWSLEEAATCCVKAGTVLMMRPLLLHSSSQVSEWHGGKHRRVVHIEYANVQLPGGLEWFEK